MSNRLTEYRAPNSSIWMRLPSISAACANRFFLLGNWRYLRDAAGATFVKDETGISKVS